MWQIGLALGLFILTAAVANCFQSEDRAVSRKSAGHDFLAFYAAGTFVRTGHADQLYDLPTIKAFEHDLVSREGLELKDDAFGPYWNPPLFAWVFVPLSRLSYPAAWNVWTIVNLACFAGAMTILCRFIAGVSNWRSWALIPLLTVVSMPFIQAIGHGQNTCISLLILTGTIALWRANRSMAAGAVAGLLFYKPQLGAIIAAALVLSVGWRALAGLAITGSIMLVTTLITLPGTLSDFLHHLAPNVAYMQVEHRYLWDRHVTLKAFWRLLLQGFEIGDLSPLTKSLYLITTLSAAACLFATIWKRRLLPASRDRLIAATIVTMPLLMPFYFDYDLLLLSAAATLVAREQLTSGTPMNKKLLAGWAILFAWMIVNPAVAGATHVNGTVLALCALSAMMMRQAMTATDSIQRPSSEPQLTPPVAARAAASRAAA